MRALCGAIITAGALVGLGLTAVGFGTRYQNFFRAGETHTRLKLGDLDTALELALVMLVAALVIGLATTFVGLAYHHERRHRERLREHGLAKETGVLS